MAGDYKTEKEVYDDVIKRARENFKDHTVQFAEYTVEDTIQMFRSERLGEQPWPHGSWSHFVKEMYDGPMGSEMDMEGWFGLGTKVVPAVVIWHWTALQVALELRKRNNG